MSNKKSNPANDRLKRDYLVNLKEARQRADATVDQVRRAIDRLEVYTGYKDFGSFNRDQALGFKKALVASKGKRSGKPIRVATAHHVIRALQDFLAWLHSQPGFRRRIDTSDIAYLNLTIKEERTAHAARSRPWAAIEQYRAALWEMPATTEIERRDRAIFALLMLTAMRDAALVSLKLKHIAIGRSHVFQDPNEVRTKSSKAINTFFYPVGDGVAEIVADWVTYLTAEKLYGPDDPLFPKTAVAQDGRQSFAVQGLAPVHWATAAPVRHIFESTFTRIGLPYVVPHSVRQTITQFGYSLNLTIEQQKAWSQNMGHDSVLTTLGSYGPLTTERQGDIIAALAKPKANLPSDEMAKQIAEIHWRLTHEKDDRSRA